jgi:hypothetical protein
MKNQLTSFIEKNCLFLSLASGRGEELGICLGEGLQGEGATLTGQVQGDQQHGVVLHVVHLHLQVQAQQSSLI